MPMKTSAIVFFAAAWFVVLTTASKAELFPELPNWSVVGSGYTGSLGYSIAGDCDINGDEFDDIIVGEPYIDLDEMTSVGRAHAYLGASDGLALAPIWTVVGKADRETLGYRVGCAGDVNADGYDDVIVGVPEYEDGVPGANNGATLLFLGSPDGPAVEPDEILTIDEPADVSSFSRRVAGVGDVNGDGYADVAVGGNSYRPDPDAEARATFFVYYGSADGLVDDPDAVVNDPELGGYSHADARIAGGDVNGDGYADVAVAGNVWTDEGEWDRRTVHVYLGSAAGISHLPDWTVVSDDPQANQGEFGFALDVGDVNGDGYDDVAVGAYAYLRPGLPKGAAFLYLGSPDGPSTIPDWTGVAPGFDGGVASYGIDVAMLGDVDGDGFGDMAISALQYYAHEGDERQGAVFVYRGSPSGPPDTPDWIGTNFELADGTFEIWIPIAAAGDVNGDGHMDLLIGDYTYPEAGDYRGAAAAYYGGPVDADDDTDDDADDDTHDDDGGDDDAGDDDADDDTGGSLDDDDIPDTHGSRGDSLVQDDDGPCGC